MWNVKTNFAPFCFVAQSCHYSFSYRYITLILQVVSKAVITGCVTFDKFLRMFATMRAVAVVEMGGVDTMGVNIRYNARIVGIVTH